MVPVVFFAALVVGGVCIVLVFHRHYEDGLFGRLALAAIGLCAFFRMSAIVESGLDVYLSPVATVLWCALALFFARHLYRFLSWRRAGENEWRKPNEAAVAGKHRATQ